MAKKKSPNKEVAWGEGLKCQNCNNCDWRISSKFSDRCRVCYYCTKCGMMYFKLNDYKIPIGWIYLFKLLRKNG